MCWCRRYWARRKLTHAVLSGPIDGHFLEFGVSAHRRWIVFPKPFECFGHGLCFGGIVDVTGIAGEHELVSVTESSCNQPCWEKNIHSIEDIEHFEPCGVHGRKRQHTLEPSLETTLCSNV
jgi:hypothetical protein